MVVASVTTWIGSGVPRFYLPLNQLFAQSNVSQIIVVPKDLNERERLRVRLPALLATEFPEVRGRVKLLPNGPPVPYPVQFRVVGIERETVRQWADQVKQVLRANPNLRGVNDNWNEQIKVLRLDIDQDKARALGVTSQAMAQASRTIVSGSTIGQYREGDKLIDVVLRQPLQERREITDLGQAYLPTASGRSVPMTQIAKVRFDWEPGVLWREGRQYAVTVQGDVVEGMQGPTVTAKLWPQLQALAARMPPGYSVQMAGVAAAAAVLAMIPLSRSVFWGPMAVAITGGLIVATVLTLLALPAMYAAWFRVRREGGVKAAPGQAKLTGSLLW